MGNYNLDPAIAKQEREIEVLRTKCMLLDIVIHNTPKSMWFTKGNAVILFRQRPIHGYDPWVFELDALQRVVNDVTQGVRPVYVFKRGK